MTSIEDFFEALGSNSLPGGSDRLSNGSPTMQLRRGNCKGYIWHSPLEKLGPSQAVPRKTSGLRLSFRIRAKVPGSKC